MIIEVIGYIEFEPENVTKKHSSQSSWKHVAMIRTNCDMHSYYAWFLKQRFGVILNKPLRGTHVTFISDRMTKQVFDNAKEIFNSKPIKFYIDIEPRSNGDHWWLRVYSSEAEDIRESMGLPRQPYYAFHLTLGNANERNIDHSYYITEVCKRHELISNQPRIPFEAHEIFKFDI